MFGCSLPNRPPHNGLSLILSLYRIDSGQLHCKNRRWDGTQVHHYRRYDGMQAHDLRRLRIKKLPIHVLYAQYNLSVTG